MFPCTACFRRIFPGGSVEGLVTASAEEESIPHHIQPRTMPHSRCLNHSVGRSGRIVRSLCFLTALLTFCIGIGIGILIPLNFDLLPSKQTNEFDRSPQGDALQIIKFEGTPPPGGVEPSVSTHSDSEHFVPPDLVSDRFPEFAEIRVLSNQLPNTVENPHKYSNYPMFRRPSVQFVPPGVSRLLSLHHDPPTQDELPPVNLTLPHPLSSPRSDILEGIFWSSKIESQLPRGFTPDQISTWRSYAHSTAVHKIEDGCGRMQNRLLTLGKNGSQACCRYRQNFDQIQGEIFSFFLGQILGLGNLAPSALSIIQPTQAKWSNVRGALNLAQWADEKPVVLTKFVPNLTPAFIPPQFRSDSRRLHPIDILLQTPAPPQASNSVNSKDSKGPDYTELAQWSDLIVFDYLTANLDRMVNNLYNLQWNPSMMESPAHNLAKEPSSGLLLFLDNESGLLHGYRLLDKYEQYHRSMLDSLCVFRRSTVVAIKRLHRDKNVGVLLRGMFSELEPEAIDFLPMIPDKSIKILNHRIDNVREQIAKCESLYPSS